MREGREHSGQESSVEKALGGKVVTRKGSEGQRRKLVLTPKD